MSSTRDPKRRRIRSVPGTGGSDETTPDGQRALRLHAGIAAIAVVLCGLVTGIFVMLGTITLAAAFGVIGLACLAIMLWALAHRRRGPRPG